MYAETLACAHFLEMTNVCAKTHEEIEYGQLLKTSSETSLGFYCWYIFRCGRWYITVGGTLCEEMRPFSRSKNNFLQLANREHCFIMVCLCEASERGVRAHSLEGTLLATYFLCSEFFWFAVNHFLLKFSLILMPLLHTC